MAVGSQQRDGFERRLGHVEQGLSVVQTEVEALTKSVGGVATKLDAIAGSMAEAQRTPWPQVLAAAGVMLTVLGFVGSFYVRDLGRSEKEIDRLRAVVARMVDPREYREDAHWIDERLDALERDVAVNTDRLANRSHRGKP